MKKLSRIYIEITNVCNLSCSFCIGNSREHRYMSTDEFSKILIQVKEFTDYIYLHVLGEPLLHPQLQELLTLAFDADIHVNITTNGTLLAHTGALLLKSPALRKVSISVHSLEHNSNYKPYLSDIISFAILAANKNIICDLRLWNLNALDIDNEPIFEQMCSLLRISSSCQSIAKNKIHESGSIKLKTNIYLGTATRFEWPSLDAPRTNMATFCHGLRNQAAILCDGTVVPCCLDSKGDIALGNIFVTPLANIFESRRAKQLYDGFSARIPSEELCRRCGYATRF